MFHAYYYDTFLIIHTTRSSNQYSKLAYYIQSVKYQKCELSCISYIWLNEEAISKRLYLPVCQVVWCVSG